MSGSTGQIALGIVGAVVGTFTGVGPTVGWAIGSAIGSVAFPPKLPGVEGPQLSDLKVQQSAYGMDIPIIYGDMRIAGSVIFSSNLKKVTNTQSVGGKGQPSQTSTTYTYFADFAVMLCDTKSGPILGIKRIWDAYTGTLIYDIGSGNNLTTLTASSTLADSIIVYPGTNTQLPDPTIESYLGVGNVPAYRKRAYVMFNNFALANFSNRIPNLEFEVVTAGTANTLTQVTHRTDAFPQANTRICRVSFNNGVIIVNSYHHTVISAIPRQYLFDYELNSVSSNQVPTAQQFDAYLGTLGTHAVWFDDYTGLVPGYDILYAGPYTMGSHKQSTPPYVNGQLMGACVDASNTRLYVLTLSSSNTIVTLSVYNEQLVLLGSNVVTVQIPVTSQLILPGYGNTIAVESDNVHLWYTDVAGTNLTYLFQINSDYSLTQLGTLATNNNGSATRWAGADQGIYAVATMGGSGAPSNQQTVNVATRNPSLATSTLTLSDIVTNLCTRKNADSEVTLTAVDIDVSALTDQVTGYAFSRQGPIRSALEQLGQAFYFDAVESDGIVKFVKRGQSVLVDVTYPDDLAVHELGIQAPVPLEIVRQQEIEVPSSITLIYSNPNNSFQLASQESRRLNITSGSPLTLQLPLAMDDGKARAVVDVMRFDAVIARNTYKFSTSKKYVMYEPTDVVTINGQPMRILSKEETISGIVNWSASAEDSRSYNKVFPAGPTTNTPPALFVPGPTQLIVMSLPPLQDTDPTPCVYLAGHGYLAGWKGAVVYNSNDNVSYSERLTIDQAATVGAATTALAKSFSAPNMFDESLSLTVQLAFGASLSSATYLQVLNGANAFALSAGVNGSSPNISGWEIIQYRSATLNGDGTYTLTGLLRGRKGTDYLEQWHAVGDTFVLLEQGIYNAGISVSDINKQKYWKAVSFGTKITDAVPVIIYDNGASIRPLSPVQIGGGHNFGGDVYITWTRRTRIGQEWTDLVDVPLGEVSQQYVIDTWADFARTTYGRRITGITTPIALYAYGNQITDFGTQPAFIYVDIYQVSETGGLGFVGQGKVPTT